MKKLSIALCFAFFFGMVVIGCTNGAGETDEDGVDVNLSRLSMTMMQAEFLRILNDSDSFLGKTIRVTGTYDSIIYSRDNVSHYVIVIPGDECCQMGFEFRRAGDYVFPDDYPEQNATIELTGTLDRYETVGMSFLYIDVIEFSVLN